MSNGIKGIGCDIVSVCRVERLMEKPRFLEKVYTSCEQAYCREHSACTAAGIWAAKEAVSKALGTGFSGFTALDVELYHDPAGQPQVILHNGAKTAAALRRIECLHVSISHETDWAIAFAVAE